MSDQRSCGSRKRVGSGQNHHSRPAFVRALECIGTCETLDSQERALCRVLLEWWNPKTGELWPAVATIAARAAMSHNGVRGIFKRLAAKGVIEFLTKSKGGITASGAGRTHHMKMTLPGWSGDASNPQPREGLSPSPTSAPPTANPQPGAGLNPQRGEREPPTPLGRTPNPVGLNPQRGEGEPSIHRSIEMTIGTIHASPEGAYSAGPWMDGREPKKKTLREALIDAGIRGENLDRLAATTLTPEDVAGELRDLFHPSVRNRPAVLAKRLAARSGIELKKSRSLDPVSRSAIAQIEEMRRQRMTGGGGGRPP